MAATEGAGRKKVLFFAEAVTLAHMARVAVLAGFIKDSEFEAVVARDPRYMSLFPDLNCRQCDLHSITSTQFLSSLAKGTPLYSAAELETYVQEDLRIIDQESPDIVVGDFRLSLSISARLRKIPYVAISNAYWSPFANLSYAIPEHPLTRVLGIPIASGLFKAVRPAVFAVHAIPLARVRKRYGLPGIGLHLNRVYTDADVLLYADIPQLVPMKKLPDSHQFVGPILWSPAHKYPDWWSKIDESMPIIYLSMGSSGRGDLLPLVADAVKDMPLQVMVSAAGQSMPAECARNVFVADYLPGDAATRLASIVICNGGSLTTYQAFTHGAPVLGIAGNLDQHLNMGAIENAGAGMRLRTDELSASAVRRAVQQLLVERSYRHHAERLKTQIGQIDVKSRFMACLCQC